MSIPLTKCRGAERFVELDSLRGLAALSVVFAHFLQLFPATGTYPRIHAIGEAARQTPLFITFAGHEAVILFFMLSGFVLSLPFLRGETLNYPGYLCRRICRIYLPYLAAVMSALGLAALCYDGPLSGLGSWANRPWAAPITGNEIAQHVMLVGSFPNARLNPVIWSLVHEMRISIIYPFVVLLLCRLDWRLVLAASFSVSFAAVVMNKLIGGATDYLYTLHYLGIFTVGLLLARHRSGVCGWFQSLRPLMKALFIAAAAGGYVYGKGMSLLVLKDWTVAAGAAGFIVVALSHPGLSRLLRWGPVRILGETSYSLYLYHAVVLLTALHLFHPRWPLPAILAVSLAVSLLMGWAAHRVLELPCITLGKWCAGTLKARRGRARKAVSTGANAADRQVIHSTP